MCKSTCKQRGTCNWINYKIYEQNPKKSKEALPKKTANLTQPTKKQNNGDIDNKVEKRKWLLKFIYQSI